MRSKGIDSEKITGATRVAMVAAVTAAWSCAFIVTGHNSTVETSSGPAEQVQWSHTSLPVCAPPDGAPIRVPGQEQDDPAGVEAGLTANGRIGGVFRPDSPILLTGLDACEQRIDRTVVTSADGSFLFTGLMPGRYALTDEYGDVLVRLDLTIESPDRSGLDLVPA